MSDRPEDPPSESPIQRALRMRKTAMARKPRPPGGGKPKQAPGMSAGASKPWVKR